MSDLTASIEAIAAPLGIAVDDPQVASALASVQADAAWEGAGEQETLSRVRTLFDSYQQIFAHGNIDAGKALDAAKQFVSQNHAVSGAIDTASGLLSAAQAAASGNMNPADVAAAFSGPVVAAMVAAGAVSAGTGAAIVAGLAVADSLLDSAGVFPTRPGFQVCPDFRITTPNPPDFAIGCVAVFDALGAITPGSKQWRAFPEQNNGADAWWYRAAPDDPPFIDWKGARWIIQEGPLSLARPITQAFPETMAVLMDPSVFVESNALSTWGVLPSNPSAEQLQVFADFQRAFAQAWKSNKEFWVNGRHGADDVQVLEHFARIWNRSHQPGQGLDVGAAPGAAEVNLAGGGLLVYSPYFTTLVTQLGRANATDVMSSDGIRLHINTGPLKPPRGAFIKGIGLHFTLTKLPAKLPVLTKGLLTKGVLSRANAHLTPAQHATIAVHVAQHATIPAHAVPASGGITVFGRKISTKQAIAGGVVAAILAKLLL